MTTPPKIRIATRASQLARWQSDWVAARLAELGAACAIVEVSSQGDREQTDAVASLGVTGVFTKEIQAAVLAGDADVAVHSLKDLPTAPTPGLVHAATPPRESAEDVLVASAARDLDELPPGARVGTGSLRRRAQLLHARPDLQVLPIRGNVDTRLRKLDEGEYDAIVLAYAGLTRLGLGDRATHFLSPHLMLPAPGQGALAVECRAADSQFLELVCRLDHAPTRLAVTAERSLLAELRGGCSAPIGAWGRIEGTELLLDAVVASGDGRTVVRARGAAKTPAAFGGVEVAAVAEQLGREVAQTLLADGAGKLIAGARGE